MFHWKQETVYSQPSNWVFPSLRLKGKQPRVANMLVEDYLRPAAMKADILSSYRNEEGKLVENDPRRFGFRNLRHSLASFLVRIKTDPKTVQSLLRHRDVKFALQFYTHSVSEDRLAAAMRCLLQFSAIPRTVPTENLISAKKVKEGTCGKRITRFAGP